MEKQKLFYKGKAIDSKDAHALPVEEKAFLTGRKPNLEKKKKENKDGSK